MKKTIITFVASYFLVCSISLLAWAREKFVDQKKSEVNILQIDPSVFLNALLDKPKVSVNKTTSVPLQPFLDSTVTLNPDVLLPLPFSASVDSCEELIRNGASFEEKVARCEPISSQIIYESPTGARIPFNHWTTEQKNRINQIYDALVREEANLGLSCPDARSSQVTSSGLAYYLTADSAFDIYAAHVAHVIYLEATRRVPWSIINLPQIQLAELFDFHSYFVPIIARRNIGLNFYPPHIRPQRDYQLPFRGMNNPNLICDPRVGFRFLSGIASSDHQNLIGSSPEETLTNITYWARNNFLHNAIPNRDAQIENAYLQRRLAARSYEDWLGVVVDRGCHSAANLFYDLAKSVNIPLIVTAMQENPNHDESSGGFGSRHHKGLVFAAATERELILQHVDDVYAEVFLNGPVFASATGMPLTLTDEKEMFFRGLWLPAEAIESLGFHFFNDLPWVVPGEGFGENSVVASVDRADFGRMLGYWESSNYLRNYILEKSYQLCSYVLMRDFCELDEGSFERSYAEQIPELTISESMSRSSNDFYNRVSYCASLYGDIDRSCGIPNRGIPISGDQAPVQGEIFTRYQTWLSNRGSQHGL